MWLRLPLEEGRIEGVEQFLADQSETRQCGGLAEASYDFVELGITLFWTL